MLRYRGTFVVCLVLVLGGLLVGSCGKKEEAEPKKGSSLLDIAKRAGGGASLDEESQQIRTMIEGAGYETAAYQEFPGQPSGKAGRVLVYHDKKGRRGGFVYLAKTGTTVHPSWHWYFDDMAPEAVEAVELNDDGLWDLRMTAGGRQIDLIQDESFTFVGPGRPDWIALNPGASEASASEATVWHCFDGDSATTWNAPLAGGQVRLEIAAPFGVEAGVLAVTVLDTGQPRGCTIFADGKKVQDVEMPAGEGTHVIRLDPAVKGAKRIAMEFKSAHGDGQAVAIAELSIR